MSTKKITLQEYQNLLTHVADRFIDFYIIYNHARINKQDDINKIFKLNKIFIDFWYENGFTDDEFDEFHLISETWDTLQSNFSYNRILNPNNLPPDKKEKFYKSVCLLRDIKEDIHVINLFNDCIKDFDYRWWIRLADIINTPSIEHYLKSFKNLQPLLGKHKNKYVSQGDKWEDQPLSDFILRNKESDFTPLLFYPEKLWPGIFYLYPDIKELGSISSLAISCHYNADPRDIQEAFKDYPYQFEKFKNYYHLNHNQFTDEPKLEKLKPLISKKTPDNTYIKKFNSIEIALTSLWVLERTHLEEADKNTTINNLVVTGLFDGELDGNKKTQIKSKIRWLEGKMSEWDNYYNDINTKPTD